MFFKKCVAFHHVSNHAGPLENRAELRNSAEHNTTSAECFPHDLITVQAILQRDDRGVVPNKFGDRCEGRGCRRNFRGQENKSVRIDLLDLRRSGDANGLRFDTSNA